jgi:hypothetical protein
MKNGCYEQYYTDAGRIVGSGLAIPSERFPVIGAKAASLRRRRGLVSVRRRAPIFDGN